MKILCILVLLFSGLSVHATPAIDDGMPILLKHIPTPKARVNVDIMFQPCRALPPTSKKCSPLTPAQSQWIKTTFAKAISPARIQATEIAALSQMIAALKSKKSEIFHAEFPQPSESFALSTYFDRKHLTVTIYATTTSLAPWILNCVESIVITPKLSWLKMGAAALATTGCLVGAFKATQRRSTHGPGNTDFSFLNSAGDFEIQENTEVFKAIQSDSPERLKKELHRIRCNIVWTQDNPQELAAFLSLPEVEASKKAAGLKRSFGRFVGSQEPRPDINTLLQLCLKYGGYQVIEQTFLLFYKLKAEIILPLAWPDTPNAGPYLWHLLGENFTTNARNLSVEHITKTIAVFLVGIMLCRKQLMFELYGVTPAIRATQPTAHDIVIVCTDPGQIKKIPLKSSLENMISLSADDRETIIENIHSMLNVLAQKIDAQQPIAAETWQQHLNDLQAACQF